MEFKVNTNAMISLVEKKPVIWDKTLDEHKEKFSVVTAWWEVCACLNKDFDRFNEDEKKRFCSFVIKKWRNVKDCWIKWHKKEQNLRSAGSRKHINKYVYNEQLKFLRKNSNFNETASKFSKPAMSDDDQTQTSESNQQPSTSFSKTKPTFKQTTKRSKTAEVDTSLPAMTLKENEERHLCFIKGVLPSLRKFNETQVLKFQMGVLELINSIQNNISNTRMHEPLCESTQNDYESESDYSNYQSCHINKNVKRHSAQSSTSASKAISLPEFQIKMSPKSSSTD